MLLTTKCPSQCFTVPPQHMQERNSKKSGLVTVEINLRVVGYLSNVCNYRLILIITKLKSLYVHINFSSCSHSDSSHQSGPPSSAVRYIPAFLNHLSGNIQLCVKTTSNIRHIIKLNR